MNFSILSRGIPIAPGNDRIRIPKRLPGLQFFTPRLPKLVSVGPICQAVFLLILLPLLYFRRQPRCCLFCFDFPKDSLFE
jgi:hypothetical protein